MPRGAKPCAERTLSEIDGIQDRNIAAVFNRLDANGNGVVTEADLDAIAQQICA